MCGQTASTESVSHVSDVLASLSSAGFANQSFIFANATAMPMPSATTRRSGSSAIRAPVYSVLTALIALSLVRSMDLLGDC